ncbi:MAG: phosphoribosyltransferase family protein [Actinomycetota bacterium]|nr:phosphoribosyltransferase family protein [Actinomycetota bacterium]
MIAYSMGTVMIFTERKSDQMELRRGFDIKKGQKIVVAEDVVTTGGSVKEVIDICHKREAEVMAVVSIVDRSQEADFGLP